MKVFYIAPHYFDLSFNTKFEILKDIASQNNIILMKAIEKGKRNFSLEETMKLYDMADHFIADLSFERPSCYYEIGYVQALGKKVELIAHKSTVIHQVIGTVRRYENLRSYEELMKEIFKKIKLNTDISP